MPASRLARSISAAVSLVALGLLAAPAGCRGPDAREERCNELQGELSRCVGGGLGRLDCSAVAEGDVERLSELTRGGSCAVVSSALPGDGDLLSATCRVLGVGCVASTTREPERSPTRYPILLVNGIDASPLFRWSDRIVDTMTSLGGHDVHLATLSPYQPPRVRAPELWRRIEDVRRETGAARVNLICHSLGGLDCRYLVSPNGLALDLGVDAASVVASITTVGTAHRGTRVADVALGLAPDGERARVVDDLTGLFGDGFGERALEHDVATRDALRALSTANAPAFNQEIIDAPGVFYQSWAGFSRPFGTATPTHDALLRELCAADEGEGLAGFAKHDWMALLLIPFSDTAGRVTDGGEVEPNDGLTPVRSARWGVFRGCVPADHMEQLGARNLPDVNVRSGFDVARFYTNVAQDLAQRGF
jgi:triacylglycerol lipase